MNAKMWERIEGLTLMNRRYSKFRFRLSLSIGGLVALLTAGTAVDGQETVSFNRDVRPILASNCFACHGPDEDKREAGFRLDVRDSVLEVEAIVPGKSNESSLVDRIFSNDEDLIMPPPHSDRSLSPKQKETLERWIAEGAKYDRHWAFKKPDVREIPAAKNSVWPRNPIDQFVLQSLKQNGLEPSNEADRYTLVRRLYLDLTGLPPSVAAADEFVNSTDPKAYSRLVGKLLLSPRYGERWAQPWLDLARYSDTNGYEKDRERSIWPYRDWVIRALNADMPYDQFSIEQLAGDMLDDPSPEQLVATGFHRNTMLNEEGGIDPLEYRFLAMVDRVATTGTVWMGLTTGCAQCHTHKYDPISHRDYYQLMALMNNADEPDLRIPDARKQDAIESARREIADLESSLRSKFPPIEGEEPEDERRQANFQKELTQWIGRQQASASKWTVIRPFEMKTNLPRLEILDDGSIFSTGDTTKRDEFDLTFDVANSDGPIHAIRIEAIPDARLPDFGPGRTYYEGRKGDFFVSEISATLDGQKIEFASVSHDFSDSKEGDARKRAENVFDGDGSTGWQPGKKKGVRLQLVMNLAKPIVAGGKLKFQMLFERHYTVSLGRFRFSTTSNPDAVANRLEEVVENCLVTKNREDWSVEENEQVVRAFLLDTPLLEDARKQIDELRAKIPLLTETMVMQERPSDNLRPTFRHHRGEYLSPKEAVSPGIPEMFTRGSVEDRLPANRLEFARWLVSESNPLVARVAVDRAWREIFGQGLMRTNGDFGTQSEPPTHPELLDWLALKYQHDLKWSTRKLHRLIVMSSTYRQTSAATEALMKRDPENRLLARGPAFRLPGEVVRDIALQASGSLCPKMYGPGVRPPQPASVTALAYGATKWKPSTGSDRNRRSIYTFKKRTASFAAYTVFDGPTGETCTARRNRSNTPLQALTVLNDEMYLEFARKIAKQTTAMKLDSNAARIVHVFRSFLTRPPTDTELASLNTYFDQQLSRLENEELDPKSIGGERSTKQQAALAMVARVIMNLDETITKR